MNPTEESYNSLVKAYDFFNARLFDSKLPKCLITFNRHRSAYGYFCHEMFSNKHNDAEKVDEIALNPKYFKDNTIEQILSTLAHEMVHLEQHHFGKPTKVIHNKEWAKLMKRIGLHPSNTHAPGGKETGQSVGHYILPGEKFDVTCSEFLKDNKVILFYETPIKKNDDEEPQKKTKLKVAGHQDDKGKDVFVWAWERDAENLIETELTLEVA